MTVILRNQHVGAAVAWAKEQIGAEGIGQDCAAVSLVDDQGEFLAVCVFSSYIGTNIDMHLAAKPGAHWLSRSYYNAVMALPFDVLQVPRITGLIRGSNLHTQRFAGRMGFQYEGRMRKIFADGEDLVLYGFLREEFERHPWRKR
jgi:RimJ/RimL family protein N-acetyltransferase